MAFTSYRVDADNVIQKGIILGPGSITFEYSEAVAKAVEWRERTDLKNVKISVQHYGS
jgi:putative IMPACT (imprinted ancient) family translation regulator